MEPGTERVRPDIIHFRHNLHNFITDCVVMPPRLNKRQLREQEELLALELAKHSDAESSDDAAESDHPPSAAPLGFAAVCLIISIPDGHHNCIYSL